MLADDGLPEELIWILPNIKWYTCTVVMHHSSSQLSYRSCFSFSNLLRLIRTKFRAIVLHKKIKKNKKNQGNMVSS